jgi:hypothetical protein
MRFGIFERKFKLIGGVKMDAKKYAEQLASYFLKSGNFVGAKKMQLGSIGDTAYGDVNGSMFQDSDSLGFGGLQVESVGYEIKEGDIIGNNINIHVRGRGKTKTKTSIENLSINIIPSSSLSTIDLKNFASKPTRGDVYKYNK